jgi:hypothetical protein
MVIARNLLRGEFTKLHGRIDVSKPHHRSLVEAFSEHLGMKPDALIGNTAKETVGNLEKAWKSKDSPLTSNIAAGLLQRTGKSTGRAVPAIVPAKTQPLSYGVQQAGATVGSGALAQLDPATAAMNYTKASLGNPAVRGLLSKNPNMGKVLSKADKTFVHSPVQKGYMLGAQGQSISPSTNLKNTYGFNALTASAASTANQLAQVARPIQPALDYATNQAAKLKKVGGARAMRANDAFHYVLMRKLGQTAQDDHKDAEARRHGYGV